jgi:hypothetical protein
MTFGLELILFSELVSSTKTVKGFLQYLKISRPIVLTDLGMVVETIPQHPSKA